MARRKAKRTNEIQKEDGRIILRDVRLSFPHLFKAKSFTEGQDPKFSATFILDKDDHADELDAIEDEIDRLVKSTFKGKRPKDDKICLRDGSEKDELDGFSEDCMFINANNTSRPRIVDRDKSQLEAEDGIIYAGCRVAGVIKLWAQDNKYGRRINATLMGVQFMEDDEPFGGGGVADDEDFDDLD